MAQKLEILILGTDQASKAFDTVHGKLAGLGNLTGGALKLGMLGATAAVGALAAGMGLLVTKAMGAELAEAQLDAVLRSTAKAAADYAEADAIKVTGTRESADAIAEMRGRLGELSLDYEISGGRLQEEKQRLWALTQQWGANSLTVKTNTAELAKSESEHQKLGGEIQTLQGKIASGSEVVTRSQAQILNMSAVAAQLSKAELKDLAGSLSMVTRFDDEAVLAGESLLLTFTGIGKDVFPAAIEMGLDMATVFGQDVKGSITQVGKALQDPAGITALKRLGVNFSEVRLEALKAQFAMGDVAGYQAAVLKELQTEFGGSAKAAGSTFAGQLDIARNSLDNLMEDMGAEFLPMLTDLTGSLTKGINSAELKAAGMRIAQSLKAGVQAAGSIMSGFQTGGLQGGTGAIRTSLLMSGMIDSSQASAIAGFVDQIQNALDALGKWWATNGPGLIATAQKLWASFASNELAFAGILIDNVRGILVKIGDWITANSPAMQAAFANIGSIISMSMGMALQVLGAVQPLLDGIVNAVLGIGTVIVKVLAGDWDGAWAAAGQVVNDLVTGIMATFQNLVTLMWNWIVTAWPQIQLLWAGLWDGIGQAVSKLPGVLADAMGKGYAALVLWLKENGPKLLEIGGNIVQGLMDGIMQAAKNLAEIAGKLIDMLISAIKEKLGIKSPSALMMDIGRQTVEGLALGIANAALLPAKAMGGIGLSLAGVAGPSLSYGMAGGGNMNSGGGNVTIVYSPGLSLADAAEFESRIAPLIRRTVREARESR